jgi:hypothetical protein
MSLESGYTATLVVHAPSGDITVVMETWADGNVDSDEAKHRNPVTRRQTARGGQRTRDNLKLTRECDAEVWALKGALEDSAGVDRCTATRQMVGPRAEAIGQPYPLTGYLKMVKFPDYDLSGNNVGMLEVEISTDEARA